MDQRIRDKIEEIESVLGPEAVLQILFEGSRVYRQAVEIVRDAITNPEGTFARKATRILKDADPEAAWGFVTETDGSFTMMIRGNPNQDVIDRINDVFDSIVSEVPGVKQAMPDLKLVMTSEPDPIE